MCMLNALAHQSSMQELDLLNPQPDPRITYSGGPKTFVGSNGLLQESPGNLLLWSNDPSNAAWTKTNVLVTPNALALRGVNFSKVEATATGGLCYQLVLGAGSARGNTVSFLVKKGSGATVMNRFTFRNDTTATNFLTFTINLDTGAITHAVGSGATAQSMGDGIWRVTASNTAFINAGDSLRLYIGFGSGTTFSVGDYSYIANLQMQKGSVATEYIFTTTAVAYAWPLEYDPITLKPIGRSVWEQRTNLLQDSNQFETTFWNKANISVTTAAGTALDGTLTARKVSHTAGASFPQIYSNNVSAAAGTRYTISLDITPINAAGICALRAWRDASNAVAVKLDFTGAVPTGALDEIGVTGSSFAIEKSGTNRWRVSLSFTPAAANSWGLRFYSGYVSGAPAAAYLIEAAQFEAGAFSSPRIINTGSQVTRVADEVTFILAGIRFNALGMTLTAQAVSGAAMPADQAAVQIDNGSSANRWILYRKTTGSALAAAARSTAGSAGDLNLSPAAPEGVAYRVVASFGDSNLRAVRDGGSVVQDTTTALPVGMTTGRVGKAAGASNYHNAPIQRLRFFPGQLADSELQALTA